MRGSWSNRRPIPMLTRRFAIFGAALFAGVPPAVAARPPHQKGAKAEPPPTGTPANTPLGPVDTAARWAFAMDFNTGAELLSKAADEEMPPSSMTKLMTLYIVY